MLITGIYPKLVDISVVHFYYILGIRCITTITFSRFLVIQPFILLFA